MAHFFTTLFADFTENIPAQLLGFVAMGIYFLSYQFNSSRKTVLFQFFSSWLYAVHFFWLGAPAGTVVNIFAVLSAAVFYFRAEKKWAATPLWPILFIAAATVFTLQNWQGPLSLLPIFSFVCSRAALWSRNARITRIFALPASVLFLIYDFASHSYAGTLTEIFALISLLIAFIRFDLLKLRQAEQHS